ncbi:MAG: ORC1-type DNA replication protein [Sulfolobaceae archaeon]|nr:ORC1-type DNA replication protein [Sulfolobales archaeon]
MKVLSDRAIDKIMEDILAGKNRLIQRPEVLDPEYIPKNLPHREQKIADLTMIFRDALTMPGKFSIRAVVFGRTGTGKTVTTMTFGKKLEQKAMETRGMRIKYIHVNCHKHRTLFLILNYLIEKMMLPVSSRGLSSQEMFKIIHEYLEKRNMYIILALDEFDYFVNTASQDDVYFLARVYDELNFLEKRIHYIFIARDFSSLAGLDKSIRDHVLMNTVEFEPYTSAQLRDILKDRAEEAFVPGSVLDEAIDFIADAYGADKGGLGNARLAIETLAQAGIIAEKEGSLVVTREHAKLANARLNPYVAQIRDDIQALDLHQILLLKAIINLTKGGKEDFFSMGRVEEEYQRVCQIYNQQPRRHTQVFEYVRKLRHLGILNTRASGKGMRGRTTLISLALPASMELEAAVEDVLNARLSGKV